MWRGKKLVVHVAGCVAVLVPVHRTLSLFPSFIIVFFVFDITYLTCISRYWQRLHVCDCICRNIILFVVTKNASNHNNQLTSTGCGQQKLQDGIHVHVNFHHQYSVGLVMHSAIKHQKIEKVRLHLQTLPCSLHHRKLYERQ